MSTQKGKGHTNKTSKRGLTNSVNARPSLAKRLNQISPPWLRRSIVSYGYILIALYTCFDGFLVLSSERTLSVPDDVYLYFMKPIVFLLSLGVYTYAIAVSVNEVRRVFDVFKISVQALSAIFLVILNYTEVYKYLGIIDPNGSLTKKPASCLYFSIVTYTTLGYGDYRPSERAQLFAASESLLGYVLLGVFVGILLQCFDKLKTRRN